MFSSLEVSWVAGWIVWDEYLVLWLPSFSILSKNDPNSFLKLCCPFHPSSLLVTSSLPELSTF